MPIGAHIQLIRNLAKVMNHRLMLALTGVYGVVRYSVSQQKGLRLDGGCPESVGREGLVDEVFAEY